MVCPIFAFLRPFLAFSAESPSRGTQTTQFKSEQKRPKNVLSTLFFAVAADVFEAFAPSQKSPNTPISTNPGQKKVGRIESFRVQTSAKPPAPRAGKKTKKTTGLGLREPCAKNDSSSRNITSISGGGNKTICKKTKRDLPRRARSPKRPD